MLRLCVNYMALSFFFMSAFVFAGGGEDALIELKITKEDKCLFDGSGLSVWENKKTKHNLMLVLAPSKVIEGHNHILNEYFLLLKLLYKLSLSVHVKFMWTLNEIKMQEIRFFSDNKIEKVYKFSTIWLSSMIEAADSRCFDLAPLIKGILKALEMYKGGDDRSEFVEMFNEVRHLLGNVSLDNQADDSIEKLSDLPLYPNNTGINVRLPKHELNKECLYMKCERRHVAIFSYNHCDKKRVSLSACLCEEASKKLRSKTKRRFGDKFLARYTVKEKQGTAAALLEEVKGFNQKHVSYFIRESNLYPQYKTEDGKINDGLPDIVKILRSYVYEAAVSKRKKMKSPLLQKILLSSNDFYDSFSYHYFSYLSSKLWEGCCFKDEAMHKKYQLIMRAWRLFYQLCRGKSFDFDVSEFQSTMPDQITLPDWVEGFKFDNIAAWDRKFRAQDDSVKCKIKMLKQEKSEREKTSIDDFNDCFKSLPSFILNNYLGDLCNFLAWANDHHNIVWNQGRLLSLIEKSCHHSDQVLSAYNMEYINKLALCQESTIDDDWKKALVMVIEREFLELNIKLVDSQERHVNFSEFVVGLGDSAKAHQGAKNIIKAVEIRPEEQIVTYDPVPSDPPVRDSTQWINGQLVQGFHETIKQLSEHKVNLTSSIKRLSQELKVKQDLLRKTNKEVAESQALLQQILVSNKTLLITTDAAFTPTESGTLEMIMGNYSAATLVTQGSKRPAVRDCVQAKRLRVGSLTESGGVESGGSIHEVLCRESNPEQSLFSQDLNIGKTINRSGSGELLSGAAASADPIGERAQQLYKRVNDGESVMVAESHVASPQSTQTEYNAAAGIDFDVMRYLNLNATVSNTLPSVDSVLPQRTGGHSDGSELSLPCSWERLDARSHTCSEVFEPEVFTTLDPHFGSDASGF